MHHTQQCGKVLIAATAQYQLLYNAERLTPTDAILDQALDTPCPTTFTEHTYTCKHIIIMMQKRLD